MGIIVDGGGAGAIGTAALVQQGAEMAVAYANAYKGGLDGHKINLVVCQNQETPAGGQACANQLVQDKVVAVVLPFTGQGATEVPTITKAGIPYITLSGASNQELMTPGAYDLTGGYPATLGAYALSAKAHGYSKFAMLVSNVPAAIQGAELLGSLVFKNAGVGYKVIPVNPGTADVTPQLQAAVSWGAKAIGLTGDVTLCSSFLKGYQTLGLTEPKYVISTCLDPSIFSTLGSVLGGSYIDTTSNATTAEDALYAAITQKFAPSVNPNPNTSADQASGLIPVLSLLDIMAGYTGRGDAGRRQGTAGAVDAAHGPVLRRHYLSLQRQGHPAAAERLLGGKRRRHRQQHRRHQRAAELQPERALQGVTAHRVTATWVTQSPPPRYAASRAAASRPSSAAGPAVTRSPCTSTAAWSATSRAS